MRDVAKLLSKCFVIGVKVDAIDHHRSRVSRSQRAECIQKRGLTCSAWTNHADELAGRDTQRNVAHDRNSEDLFLQVARVESRSGDSGCFSQEFPVEAKIEWPDAQQIPEDQFFGPEQAPIKERPASAAEVFDAPPRFRVMKNGMAP